jgi:hypothetical protein
VDVKDMACWRRNFDQRSNRGAVDRGALAGLASPYTGVVILLHAWPFKKLCHQLRHCFRAWVRKVMDGQVHLELQGNWNVRPRSPSRGIVVDGDPGNGNF